MYFSIIPDIEYDNKPIQYPFSESDYTTAKNFFRRFKVNEDLFSYSVYFKKYVITDDDRLDLLAEKIYNSPFYDWVIILTNNLINGVFDWPKSEKNLRDTIVDPDETHHYETIDVYNDEGTLVLKGGLTVDESFATTPFVYINRTVPSFIEGSKLGSDVTVRYTNFDWELKLNNDKREIYVLKREYLGGFVDAFKRENLYFRSSNYIDSQLKKTG
jgi:hypothetical protein